MQHSRFFLLGWFTRCSCVFSVTLALLVFGISCLQAEIRSGDTLQLSIKGVPSGDQKKIDGVYSVGGSGRIKLPIIGVEVNARGLSAEALSRKVEAVYKEREIYVEPVIEIQVKREIAEDDIKVQRVISVGGHVKRSGPVVFREGMTLLQAIQSAGGKDAFGSKYVELIRNDKKYVYDSSKHEAQILRVFPNDTIKVRQKRAFE